MGIADPEAALQKVREFRGLLNADRDEELEGGQTVWERLNGMRHLVEAVAQAIDPDNVERLSRREPTRRLGYRGCLPGDASSHRHSGTPSGLPTDIRPRRSDPGCQPAASVGLGGGGESVGRRPLRLGCACCV